MLPVPRPYVDGYISIISQAKSLDLELDTVRTIFSAIASKKLGFGNLSPLMVNTLGLKCAVEYSITSLNKDNIVTVGSKTFSVIAASLS